jgi:hypothetical protein
MNQQLPYKDKNDANYIMKMKLKMSHTLCWSVPLQIM